MIKFVIRQFNVLRHTDEVYVSKEGMWDTFTNIRTWNSYEEALTFVREIMPEGMYQIIQIVIKAD